MTKNDELNYNAHEVHAHMEKLMEKEGQQILLELEKHPEITSLKAPDSIKERIDAVIDWERD